MPDQGTILLYTLSTLAQTCAALAAFVGAVGLFRLEVLARRHEAMYADIYAVLGRPTATRDVVLQDARRHRVESPMLADLLRQFDAVAPAYRSSVTALAAFEAWNLLVIGAALVGFNYVECLAAWEGMFGALWVIAAVTVAVTFASILTWTGVGQQFSEKLRRILGRLRTRIRL